MKKTLFILLICLIGLNNDLFGGSTSPNFTLTLKDLNGNVVTNPLIGQTYILEVDFLGGCGHNPAYWITDIWGASTVTYGLDSNCGDVSFYNITFNGNGPSMPGSQSGVAAFYIEVTPIGSDNSMNISHSQFISNVVM